jgi:hypothetical protein
VRQFLSADFILFISASTLPVDGAASPQRRQSRRYEEVPREEGRSPLFSFVDKIRSLLLLLFFFKWKGWA